MEVQTSELIIDLDQHLNRQALLEAIHFLSLSGQTSNLSECRNLIAQAQLRLTYLALQCRTSSEIRSEILSLNRHCQHHLARTLERQQFQISSYPNLQRLLRT